MIIILYFPTYQFSKYDETLFHSFILLVLLTIVFLQGRINYGQICL